MKKKNKHNNKINKSNTLWFQARSKNKYKSWDDKLTEKNGDLAKFGNFGILKMKIWIKHNSKLFDLMKTIKNFKWFEFM